MVKVAQADKANWLFIKPSPLSILFLSLFCLSKKVTKKRQPETKQRVSGADFQLSLCATVVKTMGALMSLTNGATAFWMECFGYWLLAKKKQKGNIHPIKR